MAETCSLSKQEMVDILLEHECAVTFTKVNGETRNMHCTLADNLIPTSEQYEWNRDESLYNIRVWDIQNAGWRTFRANHVQAFSAKRAA